MLLAVASVVNELATASVLMLELEPVLEREQEPRLAALPKYLEPNLRS